MRHRPARAMYDRLEEGNGASGPLHRAHGWARQISAELGSVLLDTLGLAATIEWHVRQLQKATGVHYELAVNDAAGFELPEDYAGTIFDICNEVLSNVARHAAASRVAIALTITAHEVAMVVRDDGIGLGNGTPASGAGGIAAIRARSQTYQGLCEVADASNGGTTVTVSLPIPRVP